MLCDAELDTVALAEVLGAVVEEAVAVNDADADRDCDAATDEVPLGLRDTEGEAVLEAIAVALADGACDKDAVAEYDAEGVADA